MFVDKNGDELQVGDHIVPKEGLELLITEEKYMDEWGERCLIATQVIQPEVYSILTQDEVSSQWIKVSENDTKQVSTMQNISPVIVEEGKYIIHADQESEPILSNEEANKISRERGRVNGK